MVFSEIAAELSVTYAKFVVKPVKVNARIRGRGGGLEERMDRIKTRIGASNKRGARLWWRDEGEAGVGGLGTCIGIRIQASLLNYLLSEKVRSGRRSALLRECAEQQSCRIGERPTR